MVTVVNVRHSKRPDHYGGRPMPGWISEGYGNPFKVDNKTTRDDVIIAYALYWFQPERKHLRDKALNEIQDGQTIGCWCDPLWCHTHIIAGYLNWKRGQVA